MSENFPLSHSEDNNFWTSGPILIILFEFGGIELSLYVYQALHQIRASEKWYFFKKWAEIQLEV